MRATTLTELSQDGHRPARRRRADRLAVGWSAPVRGDRAGGVLRRAGADPRRADRRAGRQAVRRGAASTSPRPRRPGFGVVFITHNPHHAHMVGDHFVLLNRGQQKLDCTYDDITLEHLTQEMAGGDELEALSHELRGGKRITYQQAPPTASSGLLLSTADLDRRGHNPPRACVFARRHRKNTYKRAHSTVPAARLSRHGVVSSPTRSVPAPNGGGSVDAHRP